MRLYAQDTTVPVDRSKSEIERMLARYGASSFASGWTPGKATLLFEAHGRRIRFELPVPDPKEWRSDEKRAKEERRRWRCLALVIKAKLEAVASGIVSFEDEFLAHVVLPGGQLVGQWAAPHLKGVYERGANMPPLLGTGAEQ